MIAADIARRSFSGIPETARRRLARAMGDFGAAAGEIVVDPLRNFTVGSRVPAANSFRAA